MDLKEGSLPPIKVIIQIDPQVESLSPIEAIIQVGSFPPIEVIILLVPQAGSFLPIEAVI